MYNYKIEYTEPGTSTAVDITDSVSRVQIAESIGQPCREMLIDIVDPDLYNTFNFENIPTDPPIEIFTKIETTFVSQGKFFIEKPGYTTEPNSQLIQGTWGRSIHAKLFEPFAERISKEFYAEGLTVNTIIQELCDVVSLPWSSSYNECTDYNIFPNTFVIEKKYPIDAILELCVHFGGKVTAHKDGYIKIVPIDFEPSAEDYSITDSVIQAMKENTEWPSFGNRIAITPTGTISGYTIQLDVERECLRNDGIQKTKVIARVTDQDNSGVNFAIVDWTLTIGAMAEPAFTGTNTGQLQIRDEMINAISYYVLELKYPPESIISIYTYADKQRENDLSGSCLIQGKYVFLQDPLRFCDQLLRVTYVADGMTVNYIRSSNYAEDIQVFADVEGNQDSGFIYIGNQCQCPPTLEIKSVPGSVEYNTSASLIIYAEDSGPITDGRGVILNDVTYPNALGSLTWKTARLGKINLRNESSEVYNDISGISQCDVPYFIHSIDSVYAAGVDGQAVTSTDYYDSFDNKTIDLNEILITGTKLYINYTAVGGAVATFTSGSIDGTGLFRSSMFTNSETPLEADGSINVSERGDGNDDFGPNKFIDDNPDFGGVGGDEGEWDLAETECGSEGLCNKEGYSCCYTDETYVLHCVKREDCLYTPGDVPCNTMDVSGDPTSASLKERFKFALALGCDCNTICHEELTQYETSQGYDGGSYKTITQHVIDAGFTEGTSAFDEAYQLKWIEVLEDCAGECDCEIGQAGPPDLSASEIGSTEVYLYDVDDACPPFKVWFISKGSSKVCGSGTKWNKPTPFSPVIDYDEGCNDPTDSTSFCGQGEFEDLVGCDNERFTVALDDYHYSHNPLEIDISTGVPYYCNWPDSAMFAWTNTASNTCLNNITWTLNPTPSNVAWNSVTTFTLGPDRSTWPAELRSECKDFEFGNIACLNREGLPAGEIVKLSEFTFEYHAPSEAENPCACETEIRVTLCDGVSTIVSHEMEVGTIGYTTLVPDPANPATIAINSDELIGLTGTGKSPYIWTTENENCFFDQAFTLHEIVTVNPEVTVYTNASACGAVAIFAEDYCSQSVEVRLRAPGSWQNAQQGCACPLGTTNPCGFYNQSQSICQVTYQNWGCCRSPYCNDRPGTSCIYGGPGTCLDETNTNDGKTDPCRTHAPCYEVEWSGRGCGHGSDPTHCSNDCDQSDGKVCRFFIYCNYVLSYTTWSC